LVRPGTTSVGSIVIETATGSGTAAAVGSAMLPVDIPLPSLEEEGDAGSPVASTLGSATTIAQGVRDITSTQGRQPINWAANLHDFSLSQFRSMTLTMVAYTVAGYWASVENSERLREYAGSNIGFVYYLTLAVERAGGEGDLLRSSDLTTQTSLSAYLFAYRDDRVSEGERRAFQEVHDFLATARRELGNEGLVQMLRTLRRGNSFDTADRLMDITGARERGRDAARTGGRVRQ
jgi:hypothetical protein